MVIAKKGRSSMAAVGVSLATAALLVASPAVVATDDTQMITPEFASEYLDQKLTISNVSCIRLQCKATSGWSSYQGAVNIEGDVPTTQSRMRMVVTVLTKAGAIEYQDNSYAPWNEDAPYSHLVTSIPADSLHNGDYTFRVTYMGTSDELTSGRFTIQRSGGKQKSAPAATSSSQVTGTWWGVGQTTGNIELRASGTYSHNGKNGGRYKVQGNQITFTGGLSSWNSGRATFKDGVIEFYWTNTDGSINWFTFAK